MSNLSEREQIIDPGGCQHGTPWDDNCNACWADHRRRVDQRSLEETLPKDRAAYRMRAYCYNCGHGYIETIPNGVRADGSGRKCPCCGVRGTLRYRPIGATYG